MDNPANMDRVSGGTLWSGLVLPGVAWLLHFIGIWAIAEYGCIGAGFPRFHLLGVMELAWAVVLLTLVMLGATAFLGWSAVRSVRRLKAGPADAAKESDLYMARAGVYSALLFSLFILFEAIPIFYYLEGC